MNEYSKLSDLKRFRKYSLAFRASDDKNEHWNFARWSGLVAGLGIFAAGLNWHLDRAASPSDNKIPSYYSGTVQERSTRAVASAQKAAEYKADVIRIAKEREQREIYAEAERVARVAQAQKHDLEIARAIDAERTRIADEKKAAELATLSDKRIKRFQRPAEADLVVTGPSAAEPFKDLTKPRLELPAEIVTRVRPGKTNGEPNDQLSFFDVSADVLDQAFAAPVRQRYVGDRARPGDTEFGTPPL